MITERHYCGELLHIQFFFGGGDEDGIFVFHPRGDREGQGDPIEACPKCEEVLEIAFCGSPWLIDPMPHNAATKTAKNKYCSTCWGFSFEYHEAKTVDGESVGYYLACSECEEDTVGFVSAGWIDHKKADDYIYYKDDAPAMSEALGVDLPKDLEMQTSNADEARKAMGF